MNVGGKMVPPASSFTTAPLRNRIRVELTASVSAVWALIGDLTRFPEYSSGLERVVAKQDSSGTLTEYVCHFKPREEGGEGISHREIIRWYEPNRGYASSGEEGNVFGLTNDLNSVTVESSKAGTILTWDEYYDAQDLDMMRTEYDQALTDIGENLIRRFGGRVVERYVEIIPLKGIRENPVKTYDVQTVTLKVDFKKAFAFISDPRNLPRWTNAFKEADHSSALMAAPAGEIRIKLEVASDKKAGNIDWLMTFPDGSVGRAFSRLVPNGDQETIYSFVLLAPAVPLEQLEGALDEQREILKKELTHLEEILR